MNATFRLFFLVISCLVWTARASYAAQTDEANHQQNTKTSDQQVGHRHASAKNPRHQAATANRPEQRNKNRELDTTGNSVGVRQQSLNKSNGAANAALSGAAAVSMTRAGRHATVPQRSVAGPSMAPHRGPNPATVGGAASPSSKNAGAINGTYVNRKP